MKTNPIFSTEDILSDSTELASNEHNPVQNPVVQLNIIRKITEHYYHDAQVLALNNSVGRCYTDHNICHVEMVASKAKEAADKIVLSMEYRPTENNKTDSISLNSRIDVCTLNSAAISHDTGMAGLGYALSHVKEDNGIYQKDSLGHYVLHAENQDDFNEIRKNHSLNSAINVLKNRKEYLSAGFSDFQVDKIASECMAHSKSSSGVKSLNSRADWSDCFDRIDSAIIAYNNDHPAENIFFDRAHFEKSDEELGSLAAESLALRIGDVSRDSGPSAIAQSGEKVYVDRMTLNNRGGIWPAEVKNAVITIGDSKDMISSMKSRQVHAGEQNIVRNHCSVSHNLQILHIVTVADGVSAPKCTQESIADHLGELASAPNEKFDVTVYFVKPCDDYAKESYEQFRDDASVRFRNVNIHYPWDKED